MVPVHKTKSAVWYSSTAGCSLCCCCITRAYFFSFIEFTPFSWLCMIDAQKHCHVHEQRVFSDQIPNTHIMKESCEYRCLYEILTTDFTDTVFLQAQEISISNYCTMWSQHVPIPLVIVYLCQASWKRKLNCIQWNKAPWLPGIWKKRTVEKLLKKMVSCKSSDRTCCRIYQKYVTNITNRQKIELVKIFT